MFEWQEVCKKNEYTPGIKENFCNRFFSFKNRIPLKHDDDLTDVRFVYTTKLFT